MFKIVSVFSAEKVLLIKSEYFLLSHHIWFCSDQTDANPFILNSHLGIYLPTLMRLHEVSVPFDRTNL